MEDYNRKRLDDATAMISLARGIVYGVMDDERHRLNQKRDDNARATAWQKIDDITCVLESLETVEEDLAEAKAEGRRL
jgi:hypothetical protein